MFSTKTSQFIYLRFALAALVLIFTCTKALGQQGIDLPNPPGEAPTEIISGQSRSNPAKHNRARDQQDPASNQTLASPAPFLNPIAPLPRGPFYGKIKRPRKHRLDQDRDGFVSKQELDLENQVRSAAFREADQNHDGKLDASEMRHYQALVHPRGRGRH
jgi:EF hand